MMFLVKWSIIENQSWNLKKKGLWYNMEKCCVRKPAKPIRIQDAEIKEMILELQERVKNIIYENSSLFGSKNVTHLKVKHDRIQSSINDLVIFSLLPKDSQRKNNVIFNKKLKSLEWRDRVRLLILSCCQIYRLHCLIYQRTPCSWAISHIPKVICWLL